MTKKLTPAQKRDRKRAKMERQQKFDTVFINGKQVRIKREPSIDGTPMDQFIRENADPVWIHQNELWEWLPIENHISHIDITSRRQSEESDCEIPF